jgi:glycosyltransferase involved in cell wall biosynthesis
MVNFRGWVDRKNVPHILRSSEICVLPSLYEGMPNALLEAMATGLAVIATNVAGSEELIRDGENGLLVPPRDSHALESALLRLIDDEQLRLRLANAARESVVRRQSWENVTRQYLALSEKVTSGSV